MEGTIRDYRIVQPEGQRQVARPVAFYNLDVIISVGYRVKSHQGTAFRQWATQRIKEYIVKGFAIDDARLKNPPGPGVPDYFDELLDRIRDIRASEKRMYLRVREILALASDYSATSQETHAFFQVIQNKLHFAATGKTAPELISERADATQPNMGLTSWKGDGVRKGDITTAKNYLREDEIKELNRIVTMFLDHAEDQARRRKQVYLRDWHDKLDEFLKFNDRAVLLGAGKVSREAADEKAEKEYIQFNQRRRTALEAKGEDDAVRQLEGVAKSLPKKESPAKKRGRKKP